MFQQEIIGWLECQVALQGPDGPVECREGWMFRVDAHHHLWDLSVRDQPWIAGPELAALRRSFAVSELAAVALPAGVDATVVVQTVTVPDETPELLSVADPLIAGVV